MAASTLKDLEDLQHQLSGLLWQFHAPTPPEEGTPVPSASADLLTQIREARAGVVEKCQKAVLNGNATSGPLDPTSTPLVLPSPITSFNARAP